MVATSQGDKFVNRQVSSLNSHVSMSLTRNKYYTRVILGRHGLPNIPYLRPRSNVQAADFLRTHGTIIVKPLKGAGSKNIHIVRSQAQLDALSLKGCILEKYTPGREMRFLVLNGAVIAVHESRYGDSVDEHRDLERISYDVADWDPKLVAMSIEISALLGLSFSAVDYLIDESGHLYVLEVNSSPGFKWFHDPTEGPAIDVATLFMQAMIDDIA